MKCHIYSETDPELQHLTVLLATPYINIAPNYFKFSRTKLTTNKKTKGKQHRQSEQSALPGAERILCDLWCGVFSGLLNGLCLCRGGGTGEPAA